MSNHGSACSKARFAFHTEGWLMPLPRKSTLAAGAAPAKLVCWLVESGLKMPPAVGQEAKPEGPHPTTRGAPPGVEEMVEIPPVAARAWDRPPAPPSLVRTRK